MMHPPSLFWRHLLLAVAFFATFAAAAQEIEKHPLDNSESRTLTLENGLKVVLLSDPDLNISAASMAVGVGSLANPDDALGLAHFLEHMLFLGTEKYPDEAEYNAYLRQNGGYSNAYTSSDHTNYHFEVYDNAFEGALDRFAQFFIAPLFTEEFTERELNAVHSEFQKNIENDSWRTQDLYQSLGNPEHPATRFSTGSLETLKDVRRETLIDFYERHYSANQMALSLVSSVSLDQMESWVQQYFAEIPNREVERLSYPADFLQPKEALRFAQMKSTEDRRYLNLIFNLPSIEDDWDSKTAELIGHIVGYEGEGSLLSDLKDAGLATGLGASIWSPAREYSLLYVSVDLTQTGREQYQRVAEWVLGYFEVLRQADYPDYIWEEMAKIARLDELYADKGEGAGRATQLANRAYELPLDVAVRAPFIFARQDPERYFQLLEFARPENMLAMLVARDVETDEVEPYYGTEYSFKEITGERFKALREPSIDNFSLPAPNPFVPDSVDLLEERPVKLVDRADLELFYGFDTDFKRPKVSMHFRFRPAWDDLDARTAALLDLYSATFSEAVNELGYAAHMAGASYALNADVDGVVLSVSGYTASVEKLVDELVSRLRNFELSEEKFAAVKDRLLRAWENEVFGNAFQFIREYQAQAGLETYFRAPQKAESARDLTRDDLYAFRKVLYARGRIEALVYGNTTAAQARADAESVVETLAFEPVGEGGVFRQGRLVLDTGEAVLVEDVLPSNNSCYRDDFVVGPDTPRNRMALAVAANLISEPYYSEMRTRQQLGYVVASAPFSREDELNLLFLIQSGEYPPVELKNRSHALIATFPEMIAQAPAENFTNAKAAVASELKEKPTSIAEKASRFFGLAYEEKEDWNRKAEALEALETLTQEEVAEFLAAVIDPDTAKTKSTFLFARQHAEQSDGVDGINDILDWKREQTYVRED